jgi:hypothetical protein
LNDIPDESAQKERPALRLAEPVMPEPPRPRPASWPRRYGVRAFKRSIRRPRAGGLKLECKVERGAVKQSIKPGSRRRVWKIRRRNEPNRQLIRACRDKVQRANSEEIQGFIRDGLAHMFHLYAQYRPCIDPD